MLPEITTPKRPNKPEGNLEVMLHQPVDILRTKLEILASQIVERIHLRKENLHRIGNDERRVYDMLRKLVYRVLDARALSPFYEQIFSLAKERREQDVECWRDVTQVLRDFLYIFGAFEEARSQSELFK